MDPIEVIDKKIELTQKKISDLTSTLSSLKSIKTEFEKEQKKEAN